MTLSILARILTFGLLVSFSLCLPKQQPVIGIYTQSTGSDEPTTQQTSANLYTYIAASYVKFVEMSGAQVVPIFAYSEQSEIENLLSKLNGVLFPGGGEDISIKKRYGQNADFILKWAMAQNDKGNVFPIWGTCLGMQLLAYLTGNYSQGIISSVRGEVAVLNTVQFPVTKGYAFSDIPDRIMKKVTTGQGITYYNHHYAVLKSTYLSHPLLNQFWTVTGETTTSYNELFLTVIEAKKYPFYAVQFHPEKSNFEWKVYADRSYESTSLTQMLSNKFIDKCRQSKATMSQSEQSNRSIWNYHTKPTNQSFSLIYVFNQTKPADDVVSPQGFRIINPDSQIFEQFWGHPNQENNDQ